MIRSKAGEEKVKNMSWTGKKRKESDTWQNYKHGSDNGKVSDLCGDITYRRVKRWEEKEVM